MLVILIVFLVETITYGYWDNEHRDITEKAIRNYLNWVSIDPSQRHGYTELTNSSYVQDILRGSYMEDYEGTAPWLEHYCDRNNNGLFGFPSAYDRACSHWDQMIEAFQCGDLHLAYYTLGRVMHLIEDMGVPAHTLLDAHGGSWYSGGPEWYEGTYATNANNHVDDTSTNISNIDDLHSIMFDLIELSDDYDSNDVDGYSEAVDRSDGFSDAEGAIIADCCYTGAIRSVGGAFRLFFHIYNLSAVIIDPQQGHVYSGQIGIPLLASVLPPDSNTILKGVKWYYYESVPSVPPFWLEFQRIIDPNYGDLYQGTWTNDLNVAKMEIQVRAVDSQNFEGIPARVEISIDSTLPTIENTKK